MKCVLATCQPFFQRAPDDLLLQHALQQHGIDTQIVAWESADYPWHQANVVINRSTWNYYRAPETYLAWAARVAQVTLLLNSFKAVEWNIEKSQYFTALADRRIPLVPTEILQRGVQVNLDERLRALGWDTAVLKPSIAANSHGSLMVERSNSTSLRGGQALLDISLLHQEMLLQPFLSSVESRGETSHVFINGTWSHAFLKVPFQPRTATSPTPSGERGVCPSSAQRQLAEQVMHTVQGYLQVSLLFGRVDLVDESDSSPRVMEVELIEPMLHLEMAGAAQRMGAAILAHCSVSSR